MTCMLITFATDLVIMGSHDIALDVVVGALTERGLRARTIAVGSLGGGRHVRRASGKNHSLYKLDLLDGIVNSVIQED